ncbi:hypothetical protein QYF36_017065 [Acer negundo]|nr:hypothetical protein QYF36_017065 [Acer negundo]
MDIKKNFKVEILSDAEAESLFWKTVGYFEEKSDLNPIAVEIVGKCAGLPIAIKTIANALKNKSLPFWKDALDQLKKANPKNIKGMDRDVYSTIDLSFKFLEIESIQRIEFPQLRTLTLECLPRLTSFDFITFTPDIGSQEIVAEDESGGFTSLFSQNVVLPSLENLKLSSMTVQSKWLDQLPLCLEHLPKLTSFCKFVGNLIELPSLAQLEINNCPKMHTFVSNSPDADMPAIMEEQMNLEENLLSHAQPLFDKKVGIPNLKFLSIETMDNMRKIWHHQLTPDSFSKLDSFMWK